MQRHNDNALAHRPVARRRARQGQPAYFTRASSSHPGQHELAVRQMDGGGGMASLRSSSMVISIPSRRFLERAASCSRWPKAWVASRASSITRRPSVTPRIGTGRGPEAALGIPERSVDPPVGSESKTVDDLVARSGPRVRLYQHVGFCAASLPRYPGPFKRQPTISRLEGCCFRHLNISWERHPAAL